MEKTYLKAIYRIKGIVYNEGYICISENSIKGLFSLDSAEISIVNNKLYFHLLEYEPEYDIYNPIETFICTQPVSTIESPCTYFLRSRSNPSLILSLELVRRVNSFELCADILQRFEKFYSK